MLNNPQPPGLKGKIGRPAYRPGLVYPPGGAMIGAPPFPFGGMGGVIIGNGRVP